MPQTTTSPSSMPRLARTTSWKLAKAACGHVSDPCARAAIMMFSRNIAVIEPGADFEPAVDRENRADRRAEKIKILAVLRVHRRVVALLDAEQTIQVPADLAPPRQIRLEELFGIVTVFAFATPGRRTPLARDGIRQRAFCLAGQHVGAPGLHVGAARRARGDVDNALDQLARNRMVLEAAHGAPLGNRALDRRAFPVVEPGEGSRRQFLLYIDAHVIS